MTSGTFPYIWVYDYMIILTGIYFYYFTDPQSNIHIVTEWIANDVSATKIRYKITVVLLSKNTYRNDSINFISAAPQNVFTYDTAKDQKAL